MSDADALLALTTMTASGCLPYQSRQAAAPLSAAGPFTPGARWSGVIGVEGELTGDGRLIESNALRWENLPLPLRYVASDSGEHDGAVVVGQITTITRATTGQIMAEGTFDVNSPDGLEAMRQVEENLTTGVSMDLDDVSFEVRVAAELMDEDGMLGMPMLLAADPSAPDADGRVVVAEIKSDDEVRVTTDGRIRAATLLAIPAFASAQIHMAATSDLAKGDPAVPAVTTGKLPDGSHCSCDEADPAYDKDCDCSVPTPPPGAPNLKPAPGKPVPGAKAASVPSSTPAAPSSAPAPVPQVTDGMMPDGSTPCSCDEKDPSFDPACVCAEAGEGTPAEEAMDQGMMPDGTTPCSCDSADPDFDPACVCAEAQATPPATVPALVAGSAPLAPPAAWFNRPQFKGETPLVVTTEGRLYGHLAGWKTCHTSHTSAGRCVLAPHSASHYAYFHTGTVLTAEGAEIPVGHITLDTRHALERLTPAATASHYEDTGTVVADVSAGEDEFGIWVAGALRPGVSDNHVRALRSAPLSGDWRRIGAGLELVAALAVNVPGFPIPRPSGLVAGGVVKSLVAAGMLPPRQVIQPGTPGALSLDDLRYLKRLADRERAEEMSLLAAGSLPTATDLARRVRASSLARRARHPIPVERRSE